MLVTLANPVLSHINRQVFYLPSQPPSSPTWAEFEVISHKYQKI